MGQPAPAWGAVPWVDSPPLRLEDLRGRVVLIRFFTDTCPFCRATAPALARIDADYRDRGVAVIGMYHPKPGGPAAPRRRWPRWSTAGAGASRWRSTSTGPCCTRSGSTTDRRATRP
ncbi:MAG: redoxin domain-containing protein [Myxococcales bacterium]|nr:redoxin domain-containing protein [Myxococcales bacterium]